MSSVSHPHCLDPLIVHALTIRFVAEPDLSNPTRSRWERPLDTIRSFDSNIEAGYKRRSVGRSGKHNRIL